MFICNTAGDIFGEKVNLELSFHAAPTIPQLIREAASAFGGEVELRRPPAAPAGFDPVVFQLYDADGAQWVDLVDSASLTSGCQLYAFQAPSSWHTEAQGPIPAARPPRMPSVPPPPQPAPQPSPIVPTPEPQGTPSKRWPEGLSPISGPVTPFSDGDIGHSSKVRDTFSELDANRSGAVERDEWHDALALLGLPFTSQRCEALFTKADSDRDGRISLQEWETCCEMYPTLLDSIFFRFCAYWEDRRAQDVVVATLTSAARLRDAEVVAGQQLAASEQDTRAARQLLARQEDALTAALARQQQEESVLAEAVSVSGRLRDEVAALGRDLEVRGERLAEAGAVLQNAQADRRSREQLTPAGASASLEAADARLREQQAALLAAGQENKVIQERVATAAAELQRARDRAAAATGQAEESAKRVAAAQDSVAEGDVEAAAAQQRVDSAAASRGGAAHAVAAASERLAAEKRALTQAREEEARAHTARLAAERAREAQQQTLQGLLTANDTFARRRQELELSEQPLLEQEVHLRMQRDTLEVEEAVLAKQHKEFYEAAWKQARASSVPVA